MERLTTKSEKHGFCIADAQALGRDEEGYFGAAVTKLGELENLCEMLRESQSSISQRLEQLRSQGKTNSCQFRELMGKKLMNSSTISLLKAYGVYREEDRQ